MHTTRLEQDVDAGPLGPCRLIKPLPADPHKRVWQAVFPGQNEHALVDPGLVCLLGDRPAPTRRVRAWKAADVTRADPDRGVVLIHSRRGRTDLTSWLEADALRPIADLVALVAALCRGLAEAHAAGVHHGMVVPELVWVRAGSPELVDVGVEPDAPDPASADVAAVGELLCWMLTGQPAKASALTASRSPLALACRGVAPGLPDIVRRAADTNSPERYATAADLEAALIGWLATERRGRSTSPRRRLVGVAACAAIAGVSGVAGSLMEKHAAHAGVADAWRTSEQLTAQLADRSAELQTLQKRLDLQNRIARSLNDSLRYNPDRHGVVANTTPSWSLAEMLLWPLHSDPASVEFRMQFHVDRLTTARDLIEQAHESGRGEHLETLLIELNAGVWEFQLGNVQAAEELLDHAVSRLASRLDSNDPLARGATQLLELARGSKESSAGCAVVMEDWVVQLVDRALHPDEPRTIGEFDPRPGYPGWRHDSSSAESDQAFTDRVRSGMAG